MRYIVAERDPEADLPTWRVAEADAIAAEIPWPKQSPYPISRPIRPWPMRRRGKIWRWRCATGSSPSVSGPPSRSSSGPAACWALQAKAWTVRDVVATMDRHPSDGIFHLCNGTLEHWLLEEGAPHLAKLAHQAVIDGKNDRRRALEIFLIGTGLVARPRLALNPKQVNLGYILDGTTASELLRIRRGRGRGYLYGKLAAGEQWLHLCAQGFQRERR